MNEGRENPYAELDVWVEQEGVTDEEFSEDMPEVMRRFWEWQRAVELTGNLFAEATA